MRKDGTEFPVEIRLSPLATDTHTPVSSVIRDITERKLSEAQRAHLAVIKGYEDAMNRGTLGVIIASWKPAAEKLYGYSEKEIVRRRISLLVSQESPGEILNIMERFVRARLSSATKRPVYARTANASWSRSRFLQSGTVEGRLLAHP